VKRMNVSTIRKTERGAALLLVMFAVILVSGFGILMYFSSGTELRIDANYGNNLNSYYAARFGLEEVRDRIKYAASVTPGITLPSDIAGNQNGVLYVLNPANGENVDPTDSSNRFFDDQLCHDFNSGVPTGTRCTVSPMVSGWNMTPLPSLASPGTSAPYKWVRVNMKTNRIAAPYTVDGPNSTAPPDTRICWDGFNEQLSPGGSNLACDANGMQTVYMLTSLAVTPGVTQISSRKLLRSEVVAPSIRPPGAITVDAASVSPVFPATSIVSADGGIPTTAIDGRVHTVDGIVGDPNTNRCSSVAAVSTDAPQTATQIAQNLADLRKSVVIAANGSCNADGTSKSPFTCSPGLWWVRGTNVAPRYATPGSSGGSGDDHDHGGGSSSPTPTITLTGGIATLCDPSISSCYANLDLTRPELQAISASMGPTGLTMGFTQNPSSPFIGAPGNSLDPAIYQTNLANTLPNDVKLVSNLVAQSKGQANYIETTVANLAANYGSKDNPAIVVIKNTTTTSLDPGMQLTGSLSGYGVLVVPNDFEIRGSSTTPAQLQWNGIVLVQGGSAQFVIGNFARGYINGSLMLQPAPGTATTPGPAAAIQTSTSRNSSFLITYSCDSIDMAFSSLPFKIISSSETSF